MLTADEQRLGQIIRDATKGPRYVNGRTLTGVVAGTVVVDLGDQDATAVVPGSLASVIVAGQDVRLSIQANSVVVDSVLSPLTPDEAAWWDAHPPGCTALWWSATPPTSGWWLMQGQAISSSSYPRLYAIFGSSLPDTRDRFLVGASSTRAVRSTGGSAKIAVGQLPEHTHSMSHTHSLPSVLSYGGSIYRGVDPGTGVFSGDSGSIASATGAASTSTTGPTGSGQDYLPPYLAVYPIVRIG